MGHTDEEMEAGSLSPREGVDAVAQAAQPSEIDAEIKRCRKALEALEAAIDKLAGGIDPVLSDEPQCSPEAAVPTASPSSQLGRNIRELHHHAESLGSYVERLNGRIQL